MQLQQNPLKLECPIIPEIDSPKKIIRISSLIFMELFTEILILVQCADEVRAKREPSSS